jgi:hypothetical protein
LFPVNKICPFKWIVVYRPPKAYFLKLLKSEVNQDDVYYIISQFKVNVPILHYKKEKVNAVSWKIIFTLIVSLNIKKTIQTEEKADLSYVKASGTFNYIVI